MHYQVCVSLAMISPIFLSMARFMSTCLDLEPFHFASKSVEFWHASLYRSSLKNKLTLDLSHYIWKSFVADACFPNFFLIANSSRIVP